MSLNLSKRFFASEKLPLQILGAMLQWNPKSFWGFVIISPILAGISWAIDASNTTYHIVSVLILTLVVWLVVKVCNTLTNLFSLKKKDTAITWCQIIILVAIGLWLILFCLIFDMTEKPKLAVAIGVFGSVAGIIFNDKIKGIVAFIHFRNNHLLNIGDIIRVPKYDLFGEVKKVTLTTVTLYNWDTTSSVIPISTLQSDSFINLHSMMEGKTYGRRLRMVFLFDTGWFHILSESEIERIENEHNFKLFLDKEELKDGIINAKVYRLYLYHWLMGHEHISQQPRLMVRWMEQKECGMPLQVNAFILETGLDPFDWQQSMIVEHIMTSASWFGMRLYQSPSGYDVGHGDIHLTDRSATYKMDEMG